CVDHFVWTNTYTQMYGRDFSGGGGRGRIGGHGRTPRGGGQGRGWGVKIDFRKTSFLSVSQRNF
ncbi:MAG: hypothetical protein FD143_3512, partial [Ignavibacteria bacterium]